METMNLHNDIVMDSTVKAHATPPPTVEYRTCYFCGGKGRIGHELHEEDYRNCTGHDTTVWACTDIKHCNERRFAGMANK